MCASRQDTIPSLMESVLLKVACVLRLALQYERSCYYYSAQQGTIYLQILRKELGRSDGSKELKGIVEGLIQVQSELRINGGSTVVKPMVITPPILELLRARSLGPPYRLMALDTLQTFISHDILMEDVSQTEDAVFEIVDALINNNFDFNEGQSESDKLVQLQILQTIDCLIKSSTSAFLNDETAWSLVRSIHDTLTRAASLGKVAFTNTQGVFLRTYFLFCFYTK